MPRVWLLVLVVAAGCSGAVRPSASADPGDASGGTLRVGIWVRDPNDADWQASLLDPQRFSWHPLSRCCLLRTLLSYNGQAIADGGAQLRPDLAATLPEVSADGRTWTFRLRQGVRYAPPFAEREIEARDFITALERTLRVGESPYHDVIEGAGEFREGTAGTISGVRAPDRATLVFRLAEPLGDFGHILAMSYLAPIPAEALEEHDEAYAGFLVASGPYMLEGADAIDHADPDARPSWAGRQPGEMTLVRNPSWSRGVDGLRPAYADRIELVPIADWADAAQMVADGEVHIVLDPMMATTRAEVEAEPALRARVREAPMANLFLMPLNVAQPPFDDVAVRRAVNAAIDREALVGTFAPERGSAFVPVTHAFPDMAVAGLLGEYAPLYLPGSAGDPDRARELMASSAYDEDGDGRCDGEACRVLANRFGPTTDEAVASIEASLAELGISVSWVEEPSIWDPRGHVGLLALLGWTIDYPSAADFVGLMSQPGPDALDVSLLGATPDQLQAWGYETSAVPTLDDKIASCTGRTGSAAFACWAELDQLLTEQVVAWVPVARSVGAWLLSDGIDRFDISGAEGIPALDRISLRAGAEP